MDPIYVTGHKNPDTDSIVAAMAYAALRCSTSFPEKLYTVTARRT